MLHNFAAFPPTWMHIDLNSCFAGIEQQANPLLRGKPIAVAAYTTPHGCILAPSIEAKRYGVKTGMQVQEGQTLCPRLIVLPSDPPKYRFVNRALLRLLQKYSPVVSVRSIDEMVLNFRDFLDSSADKINNPRNMSQHTSLNSLAQELKNAIKAEIGDWLTVSIGIAPNPYLAKLAAGLNKPDGLDTINAQTILPTLKSLSLIDLPYIKAKNAMRLASVGITTSLEFYHASIQQLKSAFQSINGYYWHLRLHGYPVDEVEWQRRSIGHSYALPKPTDNFKELSQLLCKLVEKMGRRLRNNQLTARGIHLALGYQQEGGWHKGHLFSHTMYSGADLFESALTLLHEASPLQPVRILAVSCFDLQEDVHQQLTLFRNEIGQRSLTHAMDKVNNIWGEFTLIPATMLSVQKQNKILDRIAFGRVLDMQDVIIN